MSYTYLPIEQRYISSVKDHKERSINATKLGYILHSALQMQTKNSLVMRVLPQHPDASIPQILLLNL